jgi:Fe-S-cluster-containing dehydrogenase component
MTADKCTWCYHRITKGMNPACVQACPVGARVIGDMKDENSAVNEIIDTERIGVLKPELGTEPKVFYVGLDKEVR